MEIQGEKLISKRKELRDKVIKLEESKIALKELITKIRNFLKNPEYYSGNEDNKGLVGILGKGLQQP